jgi:hypothetical protein
MLSPKIASLSHPHKKCGNHERFEDAAEENGTLNRNPVLRVILQFRYGWPE